MSIIRFAVMAVCWLDRSGHHIQRSGHGLTWPNGCDTTGSLPLPSKISAVVMCNVWQENVVRDFELNELYLTCKKTPLTKHRDRTSAVSTTNSTTTTTSATASNSTADAPIAEASDSLPEDVDDDVKKTQ